MTTSRYLRRCAPLPHAWAHFRDTAGDGNVSITSGYLHVAVEDDATPGDLFNWSTTGSKKLGPGRTHG